MAALPRAAKGGGKGRPQHEAGKKIWAPSIMHKSGAFLRAYPGKATLDDSGASSAPWEAISMPHHFASPEALASQLTFHNTELLNRPGVGWSEAASVVENFMDVIAAGVANKILHPDLGSKMSAFSQKYDLTTSVQVLNAQSYPNLDRSHANVAAATSNLLKFAQDARTQWPCFSNIFAWGSSLMVDSLWILQMAALTTPGVFAERIQPVPLAADGAKALLLANPADGKALKALLVEELTAQHGVRAKKIAGAPAAPGPLALLHFDSDSEEAPPPPKKRKIPAHLRDELIAAAQARCINSAMYLHCMPRLVFQLWSGLSFSQAYPSQTSCQAHFHELAPP